MGGLSHITNCDGGNVIIKLEHHGIGRFWPVGTKCLTPLDHYGAIGDVYPEQMLHIIIKNQGRALQAR